jgi:DNA-binding NtrC family response regulator
MAKKPVVLVVEDNAELRHVLKEALAAEGWHVLTARDEADALEVLHQNRVSLLISDLTSPRDGDSLEAVRQEFPTLPVVALAGTGGGHPPLFFSAWQPDKLYRTISKPFKLRELLTVSREVLGAAS